MISSREPPDACKEISNHDHIKMLLSIHPSAQCPNCLGAFAQCNLKFVKSVMAHWLNAGSIRSSDVEIEPFTEYHKNDSEL